jgi:hypothetical protein
MWSSAFVSEGDLDHFVKNRWEISEGPGARGTEFEWLTSNRRHSRNDMHPRKPHNPSLSADVAASMYRRDTPVELSVEDGESREEAILRITADQVIETPKRGVLQPALRVMLEAMTQDYAKILTRIDQIASESKADSLPAISDKRDES